jgi:hypothetical protein
MASSLSVNKKSPFLRLFSPSRSGIYKRWFASGTPPENSYIKIKSLKSSAVNKKMPGLY